MNYSKILKASVVSTLLISGIATSVGPIQSVAKAENIELGTPFSYWDPREHNFQQEIKNYEVNAPQSKVEGGNDYILEQLREYYAEDVAAIEAKGYNVDFVFSEKSEYDVSIEATTKDYLYFLLGTIHLVYTEANRINLDEFVLGDIIIHAPAGTEKTENNMIVLAYNYVVTEKHLEMMGQFGFNTSAFYRSETNRVEVASGYKASDELIFVNLANVEVLFEGDEGYVAPTPKEDSIPTPKEEEAVTPAPKDEEVIVKINDLAKIDTKKEVVAKDNDTNLSITLPKGALDFEQLVKDDVESIEVVFTKGTSNHFKFEMFGNTPMFRISLTDFDKRVEFTIPAEAMMTISKVGNSLTKQVVMKKNEDGTLSAVTFTEKDGNFVVKTNTTGEFVVVNKKINFNDISNHYAKARILELATRGVVNGVGNDNYDPTREITRAEFAVILSRAFGLSTTSPAGFNDIQGKWYEKAVTALAEYGAIEGDGTGNFNPDDTISREQAMTILSRLISKEEILGDLPITTPISKTYHDSAAVSNYAKKHVNLLSTLNIINGTDQGYLLPGGSLTRGDMAKITFLTLEHLELM